MDHILLIQGDSNRHIGLFRDLENVNGIDVMTFPNHISLARKAMTRVSADAAYMLALKEQKIKRNYKRAVVVDTALGRMSRHCVDNLRSNVDELNVLILNSFDSASPSFTPVRERLSWFAESEIYTFDPVDAERFGYNYFGLHYYSQHSVGSRASSDYDCYFVGGVKGGRGSLIYDLFLHLDSMGVNALFECSKLGQRIDVSACPGIKWVNRGWQPYEAVLEKCNSSKCVIEILQEGQHAQSIRYFEAVCMNKKLLTTNNRVVELPFYDPAFMKVFHDPSEVDIDWLEDGAMPDYGYDGSFSPRNSRLFQFE